MTKFITERVASAISKLEPIEIPQDFQAVADSLNIRQVYFFDIDLSNVGVYGNGIVVLNNGNYIDFNCQRDIETVLRLLSTSEMQFTDCQ